MAEEARVGDMIVLFDGQSINVAMAHVGVEPLSRSLATRIAEELKAIPEAQLYQEVLKHYNLDDTALMVKLYGFEKAARKLVRHYEGKVKKSDRFLHRVLELLCLRARHLELKSFPRLFIGTPPLHDPEAN